jgi:nitrogenase molybdenum-iron protein alpha chain
MGSKLGIPTLFEGDANYSSFYKGVVNLGKRLHEAWLTRKLVENIAPHVESPYTDWWLEQDDPFYFSAGENKR